MNSNRRRAPMGLRSLCDGLLLLAAGLGAMNCLTGCLSVSQEGDQSEHVEAWRYDCQASTPSGSAAYDICARNYEEARYIAADRCINTLHPNMCRIDCIPDGAKICLLDINTLPGREIGDKE